MVIFDRAAAKHDLVWHLTQAELPLKGLNVGLLLLAILASIICQVRRVTILLLSRSSHLPDLLDFIRDFPLQLKWILCEGNVLLVAGHQDRDLLRNRVDVAQDVIQDLSCLTKLALVLCVEEQNNGFGTGGFDLDRLAEIVVSWHVD